MDLHVRRESTGSDIGMGVARHQDKLLELLPSERRFGGMRKTRAQALARVGGKGELGHQQQATTDVSQRPVHLADIILEDSIGQHFFQHAAEDGIGITRLDRDQSQHATPDFADDCTIDRHAGFPDALKQADHAPIPDPGTTAMDKRLNRGRTCFPSPGRSRIIALPMSASSSPPPGSPVLKVRMTRLLMSLASRLPLSWLHALGAFVGRLMALLNTREARVARRNFDLLGGALDLPDRETFVRAVMGETGRNLTELARIWGATPDRALSLIVEVKGLQTFEAARAQGKGLIVAAPHLGCWELLNLWLCRQGPMALLYRQPQHAEWEPLLTLARGQLGATQIRADAVGVRELLRVLKAGFCVGILPDQRAKGGEGVVAPFFGLPVRSMTLLSRIAQRTHVPVVFAFCERLPCGRGFRLHFLPADPGIADADHVQAVAALHRGLEDCVRLAPLQYQWTYKRFSMQPEDPHCKVYDRMR